MNRQDAKDAKKYKEGRFSREPRNSYFRLLGALGVLAVHERTKGAASGRAGSGGAVSDDRLAAHPRRETRARYSERQIDLDAECVRALGLTGVEALLDVGCGPGAFPRYLRAHGHTGRLAGLDQSAAMIAAAGEISAGSEIAWSTGEANALPFPDGSFDIVSARHMLYHVPDIPGALGEFARVTGPGGAVLAVTNGQRDVPHIAALRGDMLAHFGLPIPPLPAATFGIENAPGILRATYPVVEETIVSNAFIFTEPEPIVRYLMTMMAVRQTAEHPDLLAEVHDWLTAEATRRLAAMGGIWRDPKDVGLYRCRAA